MKFHNLGIFCLFLLLSNATDLSMRQLPEALEPELEKASFERTPLTPSYVWRPNIASIGWFMLPISFIFITAIILSIGYAINESKPSLFIPAGIFSIVFLGLWTAFFILLCKR